MSYDNNHLMEQRARIRLRFIGNTPRLIVAKPYYTLIELGQIVIGISGIFGIGMNIEALLVRDELFTLLLVEGIVCLLIYIGIELSLVHAESLQGRLSLPGSNVSEMVCKLRTHIYRPEGVTTQDRFGIPSQQQSPQMVWECARCGKECRLEPGFSPE